MSNLIDGADMIAKIHKELCPDFNCVDCSMCTEDGSCRVEDWIDKFPSPTTKQTEPQTDCGDFADRLAYERGVKHAWEVAQKVFDSTVTFYEAEQTEPKGKE